MRGGMIDIKLTRRLRLKNAKKYKKRDKSVIKNVPENVMQMIARRKRLLQEIAPVFVDLEGPIETRLFEDVN
jgi:hypothetical protein